MAGLRLKGLEPTIAMIKNDMERASRAARRRMDVEAEKIKELSVSYAPVDEGNLEDAHVIVKERDEHRRKVVYVGVDQSAPGTRANSVGDYADRMHESSYNLGPESLRKDAGRGVVGPKFLERALEERRPHLNEGLREEVKKAL